MANTVREKTVGIKLIQIPKDWLYLLFTSAGYSKLPLGSMHTACPGDTVES